MLYGIVETENQAFVEFKFLEITKHMVKEIRLH